MGKNRGSRNNPPIYGEILFNKQTEIPDGKKKVFEILCSNTSTAICRQMNLTHFLTPDTTKNSKCMKELNVRQESLIILQKNTGSNLSDIGHSNILQDMSPQETETVAKKMNKLWDFIGIKILHRKGNSQDLKDKIQKERRYLQMRHYLKA